MAPVAAALALVLAAAGAVDAKPLLSPGRHAPPTIANILANSKRGLHSAYARWYYGADHGLSKPAPLPEKRDSSLPAGWAYHGCISESWNERLLQGFAFSSSSLTPLLCLNECAKLGYALAGTEYGDECYCANSYVGSGGAPNADSSCSTPCTGDSTQTCGNAWLLSLYTYNMTGLPSCIADPSTTSVLPSAISASITASPSASANASIPVVSASITGSVNASVSASITASPSASASASAGVGSNETTSEWYSLGCAIDSSSRILTGYSQGNIKDLTVDTCLSLCEDKGFSFAGVEFGEECYCGNTVPTSITYNDNSCDVACTGNKAEKCGGGWALDLYELATAGQCDTTGSSTSALTTGNLIVTAKPSSTSAAVSASVTAAPVSSSAAAAASSAVSAVSATPSEVPASSSDHKVWAHHMVGNTYPYAQSDWLSDIQAASSYGIDGFALNMGSDSWQPARVADAYAAAKASGTGFKLFLSLDMTVMSCGSWADATALVNLVNTYASHPNQALHDGKVLVSTFAGSDCTFGTGSSSGWQSAFVDALGSTKIFFVPSIFSDINSFSSNSWMDGELNWNSAWPMGSGDITTDTDVAYMNALGSKEYMAAISPFFFTHFGANSWNKNWLYRSDDWLYCTRWEQLIAQRQSIKSLEILTWNDYGESSYIGPIKGALPAGADAWVNGYDHEAINTLTKYYSTAFKTGSYPSITKDQVILWTRPHTHDAVATSDSAGQPTGWNWTDDNLYAVVLTTGPATVTLTSGSNSQTFSVQGGLSKLKIPSAVGSISGTITRNGANVASYAPSGFSYTNSPSTYNFNYFLGSSS